MVCALVAIAVAATGAGCSSSSSDGDNPATCSPTGTWVLTETRGGGTCNPQMFGNGTDTVNVMQSGSALTWQDLNDDGTPSGAACNGTIDSACAVDVTCALSGTFPDGSGSFTGTATYHQTLAPGGSGTVNVTVTITPSDGSTPVSCDAQYTATAARK